MPSTIYLHRIDPEPAGLIETHGLVGDDLVVEPLARVLFNPSNVAQILLDHTVCSGGFFVSNYDVY